MKVVLVACSGGVVSGLLCNSIKKAGLNSNIKIECDSILNINNKENLNKYKDNDVLLIYCGANQLNKTSINTFSDSLKGIFVAPQLRYYIPNILPIIASKNIYCTSIDNNVFTSMDGNKILDYIMDKI
ncbi:Phosphotransferase system cellobiose-specific component IIB [Clostridium cavendishii DSM 21758]|uniref:Phosphotransferase system cellobiose-specific component IIB n=1 Tax=Clostridium cavendishii DSM 21758 TaxID=1121302 RepID=A0A1M6ADI7_9CLOT|nr:hypothetical protein [Clostridium cavendishii]SHI34378.1 Phosphotransferase system cellobiose-specific component IIB [Clostridium cavendishii DSM 21758]